MPVRTQNRRRAALAGLLGLTVALGGCLPAAVLSGALIGGVGLYCAGVSEAGKALAREALTGGQRLLACPEPAGAPNPDPEPDQGPR
ncbi:hypothetical protein F1188_07040 [Roseospira marina]|uniref:Lipoprotein n=1 Tax=Roseospira marina TaxID=140057 RepID=A0A5M6IEN1_9PROT|nr:hypothetical protein [Roseospira marina]KAA5606175.1 hypothetical protein F1188_07040 [Roseospira marina]MBB4314318.1 hypothetical protein [Roseospira marina]MBB5087478.1 hypothetical protein [Roseospira marina]